MVVITATVFRMMFFDLAGRSARLTVLMIYAGAAVRRDRSPRVQLPHSGSVLILGGEFRLGREFPEFGV